MQLVTLGMRTFGEVGNLIRFEEIFFLCVPATACVCDSTFDLAVTFMLKSTVSSFEGFRSNPYMKNRRDAFHL